MRRRRLAPTSDAVSRIAERSRSGWGRRGSCLASLPAVDGHDLGGLITAGEAINLSVCSDEDRREAERILEDARKTLSDEDERFLMAEDGNDT
jgi:hypothetical protein